MSLEETTLRLYRVLARALPFEFRQDTDAASWMPLTTSSGTRLVAAGPGSSSSFRVYWAIWRGASSSSTGTMRSATRIRGENAVAGPGIHTRGGRMPGNWHRAHRRHVQPDSSECAPRDSWHSRRAWTCAPSEADLIHLFQGPRGRPSFLFVRCGVHGACTHGDQSTRCRLAASLGTPGDAELFRGAGHTCGVRACVWRGGTHAWGARCCAQSSALADTSRR